MIPAPTETVKYKKRLKSPREPELRQQQVGKLLIILFTASWQSENTNTVYELANAAVEEGHKVTVFCDIDAVYNLMASQAALGQQTPAGKMAQLIEKGVEIHACSESARLRGIDPQTNLIQGTVKSSLGRCAELMETHDRIVAFG